MLTMLTSYNFVDGISFFNIMIFNKIQRQKAKAQMAETIEYSTIKGPDNPTYEPLRILSF